MEVHSEPCENQHRGIRLRTSGPETSHKHSALVLAKGCVPDRVQLYRQTHIFRVSVRVCSISQQIRRIARHRCVRD